MRIGGQRAVAGLCGVVVLLAGGCQSVPRSGQTDAVAAIRIERFAHGTHGGLGAARGVAVRDGFVYVLGARDTGLIREYRVPDRALCLEYTGRELRLTQDGRELIPDPSGLTHHPEHGTYLGGTLDERSVLVSIDWQRLLDDGNLDHAVLHIVEDDLATGGTRPEFVRFAGRWLLATADNGATDGHVRLYDPLVLAAAQRTSDPDVLVAEIPCGPSVQALHWIDGRELLVLVQNRTAGLGWRLTFVQFGRDNDFRLARPFEHFPTQDGLRGVHAWGADRLIFVTASAVRNVWFGDVDFRALD